MKDSLRKAINYTIPIALSYIFLGIAFGISLSQTGQGILYSFLSSTFVFAGSLQFMMIDFISSATPYYVVALMTVVVNARYAIYGLSFTEHYKDIPWYKKWYYVYTLSDETYSILVATSLPFKKKNHMYDFFVHNFNHIYWIIGCILGSLIGKLDFNFEGIDFIMVALFVTIVVDQFRANKSKIPAIIAICSSVLFLVFLGDYFIMPSLVLTITFLFIFRNKIESKEIKKNDISC